VVVWFARIARYTCLAKIGDLSRHPEKATARSVAVCFSTEQELASISSPTFFSYVGGNENPSIASEEVLGYRPIKPMSSFRKPRVGIVMESSGIST
jgi:hypothetical protein